MSTTFPDRQRGLGVIAAIVILVILAALAGFIVSVTTTQNVTFAQDVQGARAYQAAHAGIEWGIARWLGTAPSDTTRCPGTEASLSLVGQIGNLDGFTVEVRTALTSSSSRNFCRFEATARPSGMSASDNGKIGFVERQLSAVVEGN